MAQSGEIPPLASKPVPAGLRLRIWLGCLAGSAVASLGLVWVIGTLAPFGGAADPILLAVFPWAVCATGILTGITMAMWLDYNIVGRLRGMASAVATGEVAELRGLPARAEWGELSELTVGIQGLLTRVDRLVHEAQDARIARGRIEAVHENLIAALADWAEGTGEPLAPGQGPLADIAQILARRLGREGAGREVHRDLALGIRAGVARGLEEARETESQAERGFVEATALLTTLREIQRLRGELENALSAAGSMRAPEPGLDTIERYRAGAADAIEELVTASTESVHRLAAGLLHVQEIADQVHTLANRATLVALDAAIGTGVELGAARPGGRAAELRTLAGEVQAVTVRTAGLSREVDQEVAGAIEHMRGLRERVSAQLERVPTLPGETPTRSPELADRLLERVREMVQDAMQKGERLSAAGERASSAAQRLVRRLEDELQAIEALVAKLSDTAGAAPASGEAARPGGLRLLGPEDLASGEPPVSGAEEIQ